MLFDEFSVVFVFATAEISASRAIVVKILQSRRLSRGSRTNPYKTL